MNHLMIQKKQKLNYEMIQTTKDIHNFYKKQTINQVMQNSEIVGGAAAAAGTRNNSANTKTSSNTATKKNNNQYISEYNLLGNPKNSKMG